jgi:hypothetical protein
MNDGIIKQIISEEPEYFFNHLEVNCFIDNLKLEEIIVDDGKRCSNV